jgi:hypothetical protein
MIADADAIAIIRGNKRPDAPTWMRSGGLSAADWAVITEYIDVLQPLKAATELLEGRGKHGRFSAIYEIIPVFEHLLKRFEEAVELYENVNYDAYDEAPEDHLAINLKLAWGKANAYYKKLDDSPAYYAAVCLHPYYKNYCETSWAGKPGWLEAANAGFQRLWATYKGPLPQVSRLKTPASSSISDLIAAIADADRNREEDLNEYERWKRYELKWAQEQYDKGLNPVKY